MTAANDENEEMAQRDGASPRGAHEDEAKKRFPAGQFTPSCTSQRNPGKQRERATQGEEAEGRN